MVGKYWDQVKLDLEELIGPMRSVPGPLSAFEVLEGTYAGQTVQASWLGRVKSGSTRGSTLWIGASIGDRPIRSYVWLRSGSTIFGPKASTGDPSFDETYIVSARPPDVVSNALDADIRELIFRRWPDRDTSLTIEGGFAKIMAGTSRPGPSGQRSAPDQDQLVSILNDVVLIADKMRASYDQTRASIAAQQGEEAAVEWDRNCHAEYATRQRKSRLIIFAVVLVPVGLTALLLAALF